MSGEQMLKLRVILPRRDLASLIQLGFAREPYQFARKIRLPQVVIQKLMALSSGLTGKLTSILAQAAELAIRQKMECITLDLIEQAANFGIYKYPPVESETEHTQHSSAL
jgi:hypothetical protein